MRDILSSLEAHICIAFTAYAVYKELEKTLKRANSPFSAKRALELVENMYAVEYLLPKSLKKGKVILKMDEEQTLLHDFIKKAKDP